MFVHYKQYYCTGTIIYESGQTIVSGLKYYESPYKITKDTEFALIDRDLRTIRAKNSAIERKEILKVQFGQNEIDDLEEEGIKIDIQKTQLNAFGEIYRATKVDDFTKWGRKYYPIGSMQVVFEREIEDA